MMIENGSRYKNFKHDVLVHLWTIEIQEENDEGYNPDQIYKNHQAKIDFFGRQDIKLNFNHADYNLGLREAKGKNKKRINLCLNLQIHLIFSIQNHLILLL